MYGANRMAKPLLARRNRRLGYSVADIDEIFSCKSSNSSDGRVDPDMSRQYARKPNMVG